MSLMSTAKAPGNIICEQLKLNSLGVEGDSETIQ